MRGGRVAALSSYDTATLTRRVHPTGTASCVGGSVMAAFPRICLAGLGEGGRVTAFSSLNGYELQAGIPLALTVNGSLRA